MKIQVLRLPLILVVIAMHAFCERVRSDDKIHLSSSLLEEGLAIEPEANGQIRYFNILKNNRRVAILSLLEGKFSDEHEAMVSLMEVIEISENSEDYKRFSVEGIALGKVSGFKVIDKYHAGVLSGYVTTLFVYIKPRTLIAQLLVETDSDFKNEDLENLLKEISFSDL